MSDIQVPAHVRTFNELRNWSIEEKSTGYLLYQESENSLNLIDVCAADKLGATITRHVSPHDMHLLPRENQCVGTSIYRWRIDSFAWDKVKNGVYQMTVCQTPDTLPVNAVTFGIISNDEIQTIKTLIRPCIAYAQTFRYNGERFIHEYVPIVNGE